jgi:hypothetical protein
VPSDAFLRVTNGGQVNLPVPPQEQLEISEQLADLTRIKVESERFEQEADRGFVQHGQPKF